MGGNGIHRDSIGRCDLYSNPYDPRLQSRPALIKSRSEQYTLSQDTLASPHWKLEKEIFLKIQEQELFFMSGKWILLGRIGKYAFLTLALPPYFLCYGLPKWLFANVVPKLYAHLANWTKHLAEIAFRAGDRAFQGIKSAVSQLLNPFILLYAQAAKKIEAYSSASYRMLTRIVNFPARILHGFFIQPFIDLANQANALFRKFAQGYRSSLLAIHRGYENMLQLFGGWKNSGMLQGMARWLRGEGRAFEGFAEAFRLAKTYREHMTHALEDRFLPLLNRAVQSASRQLHSLYKAVAEPAQQILEANAAKYRKALEAWKERLHKTKDRIKSKAKDMWNESIDFLSNRVLPVVKSAADTVIPMAMLLHTILPVRLAAIFERDHSQKRSFWKMARKRSYGYAAKVKEWADRGIRHALPWLRKAKAKMKQVLKQLAEELRKVPAMAWKYLRKLFAVLWVAFKGVCLIFVFLLAWVLALVHYGVLKLHRITHRTLEALEN